MDIYFPSEYQQELRDKFNIDPQEVLDVIHAPEKLDLPTIDGLELSFFLKYVPQMPQPYYLLVNGQFVDDHIRVHMAWKINPSLDERIADLQPIELLEIFANRFGIPVNIGSEQRRFFFDETVILPPENWQEQISVENPEGNEFVQQIFTKAEEKDGKIHLRCALGLCINLDQYRAWIGNQ